VARRTRALLALVAAGAVSAGTPGTAAAHVGRTAPVATSFLAAITEVPGGIDARVVDGDQQLWLHADAGLTVVVLGFEGEPFLRFSSRGVEANERSPAYYLDRGRPAAVPRDATPRAAPLWHLLRRGHAYAWHEDRLHSLAAAARQPGSDRVGRWTVPLRIDGRPHRIVGSLLYAPDPSLVWLWPVVVATLCCIAFLRLRRPRVNECLLAVLAATTLTALLAGRAGRDLYGRPNVSGHALAGLGVTAAIVAVGAVVLLRSSEWRAVVALLVGVAGIYEGLTLLGTLLHGFVLSGFPAAAERSAASACLAAGVGLLLVVVGGDAFATRSTADA
jgi:hypothetical protein